VISRSLLLALILLAACAVSFGARDASGAPPDPTSGSQKSDDQKSVLILLTGQPGLPASSAIAAGIRSKLVSAWSTRVAIETEHVDVARFKGTDYEHHLRALYRFKYAGRPFDATVDGDWIRFAQPEFGVAPGQAAVAYDGTRLLGGGWIAETVAAAELVAA